MEDTRQMGRSKMKKIKPKRLNVILAQVKNKTKKKLPIRAGFENTPKGKEQDDNV